MKDEINLREIIETLWKGKVFIILTTIVCMFLGSIYSIFLLSPIYEVSTSLIVKGQKTDEQNQLKLDTFIRQVINNLMINKFIQNLPLDEKQYSAKSILDGIILQSDDEAKMIRITVRGSNPDFIMKTANFVAFEAGSLIEVTNRLDEIIGYKKRLGEIEDNLKITQKEVEEVNRQLQATPEKLFTKKVLADEPYMQSVAGDSKQVSNRNLGSLQLESEEINKVFTTLKEKLAESTITLSKLQTEKVNLEERITFNQKTVDELQMMKNTGELSSDRYILTPEKFNAVLVTPAQYPENAVGPNKMFNIAVAAVVGGLVCCLFLLFKEYWRKGDLTKGSNISTLSK
ncbi:Wzz/FepE/Etk N-terminal domain-containing protein [Paenibacillus flagellatus]|uniref:Polysaccharide chain length determinant N-terminal domain-containing protein n=1 Tax=Paenibacillus flagellatus TaxID=2211139 RepID=A0A2V5KFQ6_9BACL|nr:Wzz/FepE/Etk N-terminal domain-containing protein [Paenibacillus flagellatus]PYI52930.1 hypothetical protein DLM86_18155 [Paenibacillus flagellatus]